MTKSIFYIFCFISFYSFAQVRELNQALDSLNNFNDQLSETEITKPNEELVNLPDIDSKKLTNILHYAMFKSIRKKHAKSFQTSENLNRIAEVCNTILSKSKFENKTSWTNLQKYLHRSFRGINCDFSIIQATAFRVPLIKVHGKYYYDKSDIDTDLHLFKGKKKTLTKKEIEEGKTIEPKPLEPINEIELAKLYKKKIYKGLKKKHLARGTFTRIGVHILLDEKTINRKKIPTLKVIVIIGAKKLQDVDYVPIPK